MKRSDVPARQHYLPWWCRPRMHERIASDTSPCVRRRVMAATRFALSARGGATSGCHGVRRAKDCRSMSLLPALKSLQHGIAAATWSITATKAVAL